ncbi:DUF3558 family protein [Mycobacteroides chelonae]|uniref:DUF3558 family protein n=1 Tax=Mycobacteroides chelonae TaxID=1774 RepID=UPI001E48F24D|nr:DUF3558 family protein [Mycobacteroides chelonae]
MLEQMQMTWIAVVAASAAVVSGCTHDGIQGTPTPGSTSSSSSFSSSTSTSSTTTTSTNNPAHGTTFDACTAITDTDIAAWEVSPTKRDAHTAAFGQNVRGCIWDGPKWGVKIYAVDANLDQLEQPQKRFERQERVQVGARSGWLVKTSNSIGCAVAITSQQSVVAVQVDLNLELTRQRYDQCPLALQIMKQIEPKIP